ncbi:type II toxin-antitoxin system RelE/ParE family toxin [Geomonas subterranea]|uniref:Type II toxin-antitoxin system RelE/ParE family toxin n=2 Tax=Geomonas subterranea TaxID=2847989 RepID=A0ABX8LC60_9BACT|nr:type II toxin-antitoxin system RelE/ParE family toxin [Geomonas subterranea]QXE89278.1 type II toxin-antitoxin system RelE/ParE family toxin [Geomonas subterranea]QXM08610.1 type II toxin-antitoxin system RelE/ParE family toxin [Geomonas subterranea]
MPRTFSVSFAVSAVQDMEEIRNWYQEQHVPEIGEKLLREVMKSVERLASFPNSGRIVPEFGLTYLREVILPPFRIVYRLDKKTIRIVRVWRSERLLTVSL